MCRGRAGGPWHTQCSACEGRRGLREGTMMRDTREKENGGMPQPTPYDAIVILGAEGGELMAIIQVAMMGKLPYTALRDATFTHPTLAEGLNALFMTLDS